MKLRVHVAILTMALLVAGASSALATTPAPRVDPVVTTPGTQTGDSCAPEPAPAPARAAGPARDGETIIPLEMVCPPPPPGQNWYDSATPVGRIRVGRAQLGASIGAPPNAQYRVNIPITIELDVETDALAPDIWVRSGNEVGTPRTYSLMSKVPNTVEFTVTSDTFYPPGTPIEMIIHGRLGAELIFNPRIGQVTSRNVIATTADGGRIVLPQVTVSVNQTVPRP